MADRRFPLDPLSVLQLGPEPNVGVGGRHHLALHRQHPAAGGDGRFEAAGDGREGRQEEVAEAVALETAARLEAVLEQPCEQRLLPGQGRQAVADVAGRLDAQLSPQHPAAAAVVGHRDDRGDVAAVALQAAQQGRQAGAASDRHDVRARG